MAYSMRKKWTVTTSDETPEPNEYQPAVFTDRAELMDFLGLMIDKVDEYEPIEIRVGYDVVETED